MLRTVLAVALAVALLAAATPALEDARATRTERLAARELDRIGASALALAREEDPGARRTITVSLPGDSPTAAPLAFVALGGVPNGTKGIDTGDEDAFDSTDRDAFDGPDWDAFAYRVAGGQTRVRRVGTDLRVVRGVGHGNESVAADSRALVLRGGETYRVVLRLVRFRGAETVVVELRGSG